jgi:phage anti-repressor protein
MNKESALESVGIVISKVQSCLDKIREGLSVNEAWDTNDEQNWTNMFDQLQSVACFIESSGSVRVKRHRRTKEEMVIVNLKKEYKRAIAGLNRTNRKSNSLFYQKARHIKMEKYAAQATKIAFFDKKIEECKLEADNFSKAICHYTQELRYLNINTL